MSKIHEKSQFVNSEFDTPYSGQYQILSVTEADPSRFVATAHFLALPWREQKVRTLKHYTARVIETPGNGLGVDFSVKAADNICYSLRMIISAEILSIYIEGFWASHQKRAQL